MVFLKSEVRIISTFDILENNFIQKIDIDNVMRMKNGKFLISYLNKLKIYNLSKDDNNIYSLDLDFKFPEFLKSNIVSFIELDEEKIVVLSDGYLTVVKGNYIYKNNFYLDEKIYSLLKVNEKKFVSISEIKGKDNCCHIQIWDSDTISLKYISMSHYHFIKNKNNGIKFKNDSILLLSDKSPSTNFANSISIFNLERKEYNNIDLFNVKEFSNVFPISDKCFIISYKNNGNYYLEQYEYYNRNPTLIGMKVIGIKEIIKVIYIGEYLIIAEKEGKISVFK